MTPSGPSLLTEMSLWRTIEIEHRSMFISIHQMLCGIVGCLLQHTLVPLSTFGLTV
jgi:hypothetical protein